MPVLVDMRENSLEVELYPEPAFEGKAQVWKEKKEKNKGMKWKLYVSEHIANN